MTIHGAVSVVLGMCLGILTASCARLPYTTNIVHQDDRVAVALQHELDKPAYSHPVQLSKDELRAILGRFSYRPKQRMPLRWFAEEDPPKPLFRLDELDALTGHLSEGLAAASPTERVHFEVRAPGLNPASRNDVVAGWVAVRDPYLYVAFDYVHVQIPNHKFDPYDYNYPTPAQNPRDYLLYFEPGRFWVTDPQGVQALEYREFLKTPQAGGAGVLR
jgi:hypothetical protein